MALSVTKLSGALRGAMSRLSAHQRAFVDCSSWRASASAWLTSTLASRLQGDTFAVAEMRAISRVPIKGNQEQSRSIKSNQGPSRAIQGNPGLSRAIQGNQEQSRAIQGNQRRSHFAVAEMRAISASVCDWRISTSLSTRVTSSA